jgi:Ca2+-binding RTX toxin-like protein
MEGVGVPKAFVFAVMLFTILPSSAFASTAFVRGSDGLLVYRAAPGEANAVEIREASGANIVDTGAVITAGAGCNQVSNHEVDCFGSFPLGIQTADVRLRDRRDTASLVFQDSVGFSFAGQEGDDQLTLCAQCPGALLGGPGADALHGGDLGGRLSGGRGPDILTTGEQGGEMLGGRGADRLVGGSGKDLLRPGKGEDRASGGPGGDTFGARDGFRDILRGGKGTDSARVDFGLDVTRSIATFF